jgi:hypothetical protein
MPESEYLEKAAPQEKPAPEEDMGKERTSGSIS